MNDSANPGFGIQSPSEHSHAAHRRPARYLIIIDSAGASTALLFLDTRQAAGEFSAAAEEVAEMTRGLTPAKSGLDAGWDTALAGSSAAERAAADVYTLDV